MNRLEAIRYMRKGGSISVNCVGREIVHGRPHTFRVHIRLMPSNIIHAVFDCDVMKRNYHIYMHPRQLLTFLRLQFKTTFHYNDIVPASAAA